MITYTVEYLKRDHPAKTHGYNYNVKILVDGVYCGIGKFCKDSRDIAKIAEEHGALNIMCNDCNRLGDGCPGCKCQVYDGCIYKN